HPDGAPHPLAAPAAPRPCRRGGGHRRGRETAGSGGEGHRVRGRARAPARAGRARGVHAGSGSPAGARNARGQGPRAFRRLVWKRELQPRLVAASRTEATGARAASATLAARCTTRRLRRRVQTHDVLRLRPLRLLDDVELHLLTLVEHLEAGALDGAVVDEDVGPVLGGQEAVTLFLRAPLDVALGTSHRDTPVME